MLESLNATLSDQSLHNTIWSSLPSLIVWYHSFVMAKNYKHQDTIRKKDTKSFGKAEGLLGIQFVARQQMEGQTDPITE